VAEPRAIEGVTFNAQRSTLNVKVMGKGDATLMRMKRRAIFRIGWRCLAMGLLAALGAQARPVVFVSIPPQAWLVKRLAGDAAEVQTLLAAGVNPHT